MNVERVAKLRETLQWLASEEFDGMFNISRFWLEDENARCNTGGCLAGWYVHKHPGCGLQFVRGRENSQEELAELSVCLPELVVELQCSGNWAWQYSLYSLAKHFDLPERTIAELFRINTDSLPPLHANDARGWALRGLEILDGLSADDVCDIEDPVGIRRGLNL